MNMKIGAIALVIIAGLTLTSCASPDAPDNTSTPSTGQTVAPDTGDLAPGDSVDAVRAAELNEAEGALRAYELADGSFEVVASDAALSKSITSDIASQLAAIPTATGPEDSEAVEVAVGDLVFRAKQETGRTVVVITKLWVGDPADSQVPRGIERWVHIGDSMHEAFELWEYLRGDGLADEYIAELKSGVVGNPAYELFIHN